MSSGSFGPALLRGAPRQVVECFEIAAAGGVQRRLAAAADVGAGRRLGEREQQEGKDRDGDEHERWYTGHATHLYRPKRTV